MLKKGFGNFIMNNDKEFLATEPIGKLLLRLAIPTLAAQMINMLYNIIDRIYIGHIPGSGALALTGVGVCMPLIMIISAFAALVGNGGAPRASILMGKKDLDSAENILGNCFTMQIIISVILTLIMFFGNRTFLMAFGASENTIEYAVSYMNIYSLGTIFVQLTLGMNAFITAQGFAKTGMYSVLIGAVINIILDPIFIFACHMGVRGAALATIISQACSCIWVLSFLFGTRSTLRIKKQNLTLKAPVILPCLALGLSLFIMQASESIISVCFNSSLLKYGGDVAVGAMTILTSVMQFAMLPLQGLGQGAQPIIGFNYGAAQYSRVKKTYRLAATVATIIAVIAFAGFQIFPRQITALFGSGDELYEQFAVSYFRILMFCTFLNGIQPLTANFFTSIGKAPMGIFISMTRQIIFLIPLVLLLPLAFGIEGVMFAGPISDGVAGVLAIILVLRQFKKMPAEGQAN